MNDTRDMKQNCDLLFMFDDLTTINAKTRTLYDLISLIHNFVNNRDDVHAIFMNDDNAGEIYVIRDFDIFRRFKIDEIDETMILFDDF